LTAANDLAFTIHDNTDATVVQIERGAIGAAVLAGAALAQHGDAALLHQLPELDQRQPQAGGDQRGIDFDPGCGRLQLQRDRIA